MPSNGDNNWPKKPGDHHLHRRRPTSSSAAHYELAEAPSPPRSTLAEPPYQPRPGDDMVRLVPSQHRLRRVLGVSGLFATGYGNVGSSIYYALGVTALFALGAAPIALTLAGVLFVLTVLTYTEATVAVPEAGGASSFARHGLGEFPGFFTGWATLLSYTVTIAISSYTAGGYLAIFFPVLSHFPYNVIFAVGVILFLVTLNVIGIQEAASLSVVFAAIDLLTQIVLVVVGGIFIFSLPLLVGQIHFGVAPTWQGFVSGVAIAMVAYTGIETISNMAEEARAPSRTVPRSYAGLIFAVLVLFAGISTIALSAMPVQYIDGQYTTELATTYINDPVAGIAHKLPVPFSTLLTPMVGILASSILLIGANAGVIGVSRLSFSMGAHRQIPKFLNQVHPRFHTPYVAIVLFGLIAAGLAMTGSIAQMSEAYIFGTTLNFTMAHVALIGMRIREPNLKRPFNLPLSVRVRGRLIPLTAVVGGLGTFAVWLMILANNPFGRWVGLAWLVSGTVLFIVYRKRNGLPLNAPAPVTEQAWTKVFIRYPRVVGPAPAPRITQTGSPEGESRPVVKGHLGGEWRRGLLGVAVWLVIFAYFVVSDFATDGEWQWAFWGFIAVVGLRVIRLRILAGRLMLIAGTAWASFSSLAFLALDAVDYVSLWAPQAIVPLVVLMAWNWYGYHTHRSYLALP